MTLPVTDFNLHDVLLAQKESTDISSPRTYQDTSEQYFNTSVTEIGLEHFMISTDFSDDIEYRSNLPISSHLRHDFVANKTFGSTDESLRVLGIDSGLTPDAVIVQPKKALELGTTLANGYESLMTSYNAKRLSYEALLTQHSATFFIIIVSPRLIVTNCILSQPTADELMKRCRCGLSLERQIESKIGRLLQDSDGKVTLQHSTIRSALSKVEILPHEQTPQMNETLREEARSELTEQDKLEVQRILKHSLRKAAVTREEKLSRDPSKALAKELDHYMENFNKIGTRGGDKRVSIFPIVVMNDSPWNSRRHVKNIGVNSNCPDDIYNLWKASERTLAENDDKMFTFNKIKSREEALSDGKATLRHDMRKRSVFSPNLSRSDMDHLALSGPGAKMRSELDEIKAKEAQSKLSFSPNANVDDIKSFIEGEALTGMRSSENIQDSILETLIKSKEESHKNAESCNVFRWTRHRDITQHASLITDICTELSYEYKMPNKEDQWGLKILRNSRTKVLYRSTGTHLFFSVAMDKQDTEVMDTGRLGPEIYETDNYYITDMSSISEDGLDHFIKSLPYSMALQSLISQIQGLPLPEQSSTLPVTYWQMLKTVYLLFLNNKLDSEEIITSVRYLYMNAFQESYRDISVFVDRLPEVLRSRLSVYLLNRVINIMKTFAERPVKRIRLRDKDGSSRFKIMAIPNIFTEGGLDMSQLINTFYMGYVVSKSRGKIGERNVKVMSKLLIEEFWFLDNIVGKNVCLWEKRDEPLKHAWSLPLVKYMIDNHLSKLQKLYGGGFKEILEAKILSSISESTFLEAATLKASAKEEEEHFVIPSEEEYHDYASLKKKLMERNPTQQGKRPRVITKLIETVDKYSKDTGDKNPLLIHVAVWSLNKLFKKGYFISDCFPKDQHGGDREIHVLHIKARLAQFIFEKIMRAICDFFPHDSILNPSYKETFYKDHQKKAQTQLGAHLTVCKSADAAKWCQRHHSSCFYAIGSRYVPDFIEPFLYSLMFLWTKKRIALPVDIISNFTHNQNVESSNDFYKTFKSKFYKAELPFVNNKQRNTVIVSAGMWQGILHIASTLKHSLIQDFWRDYCKSYLVNQKVNCVVDVIQGSDDSAAMISISSGKKEIFHLCEVLMEMKENIATWISIWKSEPKSCVGSINLVEYNSEWVYDSHVLKPTTRWALACLETTLVEKFATRLDIYYGILGQTLESGGSTFLCSLLQMCQGYMHYMLIGMRNNILRDEILELILQKHLVPLGFFPLDSDLNAGITGLDFLMYRTHKLFNVPGHSYDFEEIAPTAKIEYLEKASKDLRRDINSSVIQFGNYHIWNKLLEEADVEPLEELLKLVDQNPRELYLPTKSWLSNRLACSLKLYQPGVKSSLSSHQPNIRMMSASSYIATRPCISLPRHGMKTKHSLYELLIKSNNYYGEVPKDLALNLDFPHQKEYEQFNTYLSSLLQTYFFQKVEMRRSDKTTVLVWGSQMEQETPLMSICIRAWWKVKSVKISTTMFNHMWAQTKVKFPFLRDSCEETCKQNGLNNLELYYFLQTVSKRVKKLKLQDTSNKDPLLESAMTRIYWPNIKIRSAAVKSASDIKKIKSSLFSLLTFPYIRSKKWSLVKVLFQESPTLNSMFSVVPRSGRRLKIMYDLIKSGNIPQMIQDIESLKRGCIGFFSMRQPKKIESGVVTYSGVGEWIGRVCGVSCMISMENGIVKSVKLERLTDLIELSSSLRDLIREFKLKMPEMPTYTGSQLYLTEMGNFEHSQYVIKNSCPIKFDTSFKVTVLDELNNYNWKVKISETKLSITCSTKNKTMEKMEYTILSETLTSRDWDPSNFQEIAHDPPLYKWMSGVPISFMELQDLVGFPITNEGTVALQKILKEMKYVPTNNVDLSRLSSLLKNSIMRRYSPKWKSGFLTASKKELEKDKDQAISDSMIQYLMDFTDPVESIMEELYEREAAILEEQEEDDYQSDDLLDEGVIERLKDMLFSVEWSYEDEILQKKLFKTQMPETNGFFQNMYDWIDIDGLGNIIEGLPSDGIVSEDVLKKLASSIETRYVLALSFHVISPFKYRSNLTPMIETVNNAASSLSSFTEDYIIHRDPAELTESLTQLEQLLPSVSGLLHEKFSRMIMKYKSELAVVNASGQHSMLVYIPYWLFIDHFIQKIRTNGIWEKTFPHSDLHTIRTILIGECLDIIAGKFRSNAISENKKEELFASAWAETTSPHLVELLCVGLRLAIKISRNGEEIFKHLPASFNDIVELSFEDVEVDASSPTDSKKKEPINSFGRSRWVEE